MTKINENNNYFNWIYKIGFFVILALPILVMPPWFFPVDWGKSIVFRSIMSILLVLFLWKNIYKNDGVSLPNFKKNMLSWILGGLLGIFLLATVFSVDPNFSLWGSPYRGGGVITFAFCLILAIITYTIFKKEEWKKAWIFSIFIAILVSILAIVQYYGLFNTLILSMPGRPSSTMGNPDILAIYLLLLSFLTLTFAINENKIWLKIFYITSLLIFLYTILITGSRAAYLGIAIGFLYFLLFYPKRIKGLKITTLSLAVLSMVIIFCANTITQYPNFLQQNKLFSSVISRLSLATVANDPRFAAWEISLNALKSKPLLGYGPENFAVGFDKYYNPSLKNLSQDVGWYDKAHNIILDIGIQTGILGILMYLTLFIILLWQLHKLKTADSYGLKTDLYGYNIIAHGIQATLIGYFVANFFSFDTFSTYLIFFLLIGYSLHLISSDTTELGNQHKSAIISVNPRIKSIVISILFCVLIVFIYQYNFVPLQINTQINKATILVDQKKCDQAFSIMDKVLTKHSFLDSYVRLQYIGFEGTCSKFYPENNLNYTKKGVEILNEAVKIQPFYTRYWIYLGTFATTIAEQEEDATKKNNLLEQANSYLNKALQLAPKHQEILIAKAKIEIVSGNYSNTKDYAEKCILASADLGGCYWYLGLSEIYLKSISEAEKNIKTASEKGYNIDSEISLVELANSYNYNNDYKNLAVTFKKLTVANPNAVQYHSSLATVYAKLGKYSEARQEAMKVLQLSPTSKENVDAFLDTLPY